MKAEDLTKEQRIKKEISRLKKLYKDMPEQTMKKVISLIENAAFMEITLQDLQDDINKNGAVSEYQNGENQFGTKESPEASIYNKMIKNLMGAIKQLTDLTPQAPQEIKKEDKFLKILKREGNG